MITFNLTQIARAFEVSRPTAYKIIARDDFPRPLPQRLSLTGHRKPPEWNAAEVLAWYEASGK